MVPRLRRKDSRVVFGERRNLEDAYMRLFSQFASSDEQVKGLANPPSDHATKVESKLETHAELLDKSLGGHLLANGSGDNGRRANEDARACAFVLCQPRVE